MSSSKSKIKPRKKARVASKPAKSLGNKAAFEEPPLPAHLPQVAQDDLYSIIRRDALKQPSPPPVDGHPLPGPQIDASSIPLPPSPPPDNAESSKETALNQILILLDDIDPSYVSTVVSGLITQGHQQSDQIVDLAMEEIFANPKGYPRVDKKRKRDGDDEGGDGSPSKKAKGKASAVDYMSENRNGSGEDYLKLSFESLYEEFEYVPIDL